MRRSTRSGSSAPTSPRLREQSGTLRLALDQNFPTPLIRRSVTTFRPGSRSRPCTRSTRGYRTPTTVPCSSLHQLDGEG